ncbi:MAG: S1-like domain-containing RNA-binding protein [Pseudomonadota bacterium]
MNDVSTIALGQTHTLEVVKEVDFGLYLNAGNLGEVLLPIKYEPEFINIGDSLEVFVYLDSEKRPIATTQTPKAKVGEFAYLRVNDVNKVGAFLDWGLDKDLLVPFSEQHRTMEEGKSYLVYVYINDADGRIVASSKVDKFAEDENEDLEPKQAVELIIANSTELGYKAVVNHRYWGVLYSNEVFQTLSFGQRINGFVKRIREDGKIDLVLQIAREVRDTHSGTIVEYLDKQTNGFAPLHDKSDPELIKKTFSMSKKAFKRAIGGLYKDGVLEIRDDGIRLID